MLLEISGEIIAQRMKGWSQSKNNTKIRVIIFFAAKVGEALYSQQNKTRS